MKVLINFPASQQVSKPDPFLENCIKRLLVERKKIEVVKAYHCGLKEAKDSVDIIKMQMHMKSYLACHLPPRLNSDPFVEGAQRNRGCLVLVLAILLVTFSGLIFFFLTEKGS